MARRRKKGVNMAADMYYAKPGPITPIALAGQRIAVWAGAQWEAFRIKYLEPLPRGSPLVFDLGPIIALQDSNPTQLANLVMSTDPPELAQFRFYPIDDVEVNLRRGQSDQRFKTMNLVARSDVFTRRVDPCLHTTEFVVLKNDAPWLVHHNPTAYNITISRTAFFGFRFILDDLKIAHPTVTEMERALSPITFVAAGGL